MVTLTHLTSTFRVTVTGTVGSSGTLGAETKIALQRTLATFTRDMGAHAILTEENFILGKYPSMIVTEPPPSVTLAIRNHLADVLPILTFPTGIHLTITTHMNTNRITIRQDLRPAPLPPAHLRFITLWPNMACMSTATEMGLIMYTDPEKPMRRLALKMATGMYRTCTIPTNLTTTARILTPHTTTARTTTALTARIATGPTHTALTTTARMSTIPTATILTITTRTATIPTIPTGTFPMFTARLEKLLQRHGKEFGGRSATALGTHQQQLDMCFLFFAVVGAIPQNTRPL